MVKAPTKKARKKTRSKPVRAARKAPRRRPVRFKIDPSAVVTVAELARLAGVSADTIQNCAKQDPNAPARLGEKYVREPWLAYLQARKLYGPKFWKIMTPQERAAAISGNVTPQEIEAGGAPTPASIEHLEHASDESTTPAELMTLSPGDLLKTKMAEEILARRLARLERKRRLIPRAEVEEHIFARAQQMLSFKRQIKLELPAKLVGLERPEIEARIGEALDELFRRIATLGDPLKAPPAAAQQPAAAPTTAASPTPDEKKPND